MADLKEYVVTVDENQRNNLFVYSQQCANKSYGIG